MRFAGVRGAHSGLIERRPRVGDQLLDLANAVVRADGSATAITRSTTGSLTPVEASRSGAARVSASLNAA
jgi:hypothetical protein